MKINEHKAITELRRVSMTPVQKAALWSKLDLYAAKHQPVKSEAFMTLCLKYVKSFFS